jgi:glucosyl-3-phosphoglycerate synthase
MLGRPLVDELVVMDSDSTDGTADVARAAGADVVAPADVLPAHGTRPGKGEALWKSLAATTGDLVVFLDADLLGDVVHFVPGLLGPLLTDPQVAYVKGCYTRPLEIAGEEQPAGGGRVTELTARPLLNALWPELAGFVQPLGGEYAGRRSALEQVPFLSGYGVEAGLLIDLLELGGLGSLAQVDLGVRRHTSQSEEALGAMAGQVVSALLGRRSETQPSGLLTQFRRDGSGFVPRSSAVAVDERPPMVSIAEYRSLRAGMAG